MLSLVLFIAKSLILSALFFTVITVFNGPTWAGVLGAVLMLAISLYGQYISKIIQQRSMDNKRAIREVNQNLERNLHTMRATLSALTTKIEPAPVDQMQPLPKDYATRSAIPPRANVDKTNIIVVGGRIGSYDDNSPDQTTDVRL